MKTREGRWKQMVAIGAALALLAAFFWWQNNGLTVSRYEFTSTKVPRELDGYTIVQLSDLHNHRFGDGQRRLLKLVEELEPDLVLMTGDLVDRNRTDLIPALELAKGTSELAPTYYITGNHEWSIADRERTELLEGMTEAGVVVLEDRCAVLPVGESCLVLAGLSDESLRDGTVDWLMEDVPDDYPSCWPTSPNLFPTTPGPERTLYFPATPTAARYGCLLWAASMRRGRDSCPN